MPSVQARSQGWAAQAGLWVLVDSRHEREEVLHIGLEAELQILAGEARHIGLVEVLEEEGGHSLVEEAHHIAGGVQAALHIVPEAVLEEARHNVLVVEEGGHNLAEVERRIADVVQVVVGHSPAAEGDHRNHPVGADRRSNQTCLLVLFLS